MENKGKRSFLLFASGVFLGVILGLIIAWAFLGNGDSSWYSDKDKGISGEQETVKKDTLLADEQSPATKDLKPRPEKSTTKTKDMPEVYDNKVNMTSSDSAYITDSSMISSLTDSLPLDSNDIGAVAERYPGEEIPDDDITVLSDQLLYTRYIESKAETTRGLNVDSLLNDNPGNKSKQEEVRVEFWRSPINYTGYLLSGRKLILFGMYEFDSVSILQRNTNEIIMKYKSQTYRLAEYDDFQPFVPIENK